MNKENNKIEELLSRMKVHDLTDAEKDMAWNRIEAKMAQKELLSVKSLLSNLIIKKHMIVPLIVILGLLAGTGGTAAAANSAKPGDALFGLDQAVERIRINLARGEEKNDLRLKFAEERLGEINELVGDKKVSVTESSVVEIEADVFTNETIVKIETSSSRKVVFVTDAKTRAEVVEAIAKKYPSLSKAYIESKLDLETEDRASRPEDKEVSSSSKLSDDEENRVNLGLEAALNLVNKVEDEDDERLEGLTARLNSLIDELPDGAEVKVNDNKVRIESEDGRIDIKEKSDGDTRIESRTEDGRVRVEIKDGIVEVRTKDSNGGWSGNESDDDNEDNDNDDSSRGLEEAEAKILNGVTTVKVEINDSKYVFTTSATTREGIIAAIIAKYPGLTSAQISAVLEIEHDDSDSDDEDKDSDSDDDEDEEDDDRSGNSGKGSR